MVQGSNKLIWIIRNILSLFSHTFVCLWRKWSYILFMRDHKRCQHHYAHAYSTCFYLFFRHIQHQHTLRAPCVNSTHPWQFLESKHFQEQNLDNGLLLKILSQSQVSKLSPVLDTNSPCVVTVCRGTGNKDFSAKKRKELEFLEQLLSGWAWNCTFTWGAEPRPPLNDGAYN